MCCLITQLYYYALLPATSNALKALWVTVQAKKSMTNALISSTFTQILHQTITCILQIIIYAVREKGMEHKENKGKHQDVSIGAAVVGERHISG